MAIVMEMPKLSDTMAEGSVARWLKKEGEKVAVGLPVIEIETDKATMEYEAPASGVLLKILVGDGQKCPLQAPIAIIGKAEENWQEILERHTAKKSGGAKKTSSPPTSSENKGASSEPRASTKASQPTTEAPAIKASPLARKIAADKGIDLSGLQGTGPHGRIIQRDVEAASLPATETQGGEAATATVAASFAVSSEQKIPHTNMRRTIARRLAESVNTAPHFFLTISINMTNILAWRKSVLATLSEEQKFSVNDLVIFLTARALKAHPLINSSWQDDYIVQYGDVHMSVAVALPNGLVTPVIRHADRLSVTTIGSESRRLVKLAKEGKLQPSDYSGGTFSISNLGMSGIEEFTAIINPPQAAILAVGSTIPVPVVLQDGSVGVEQRMKVTLSCDHRVIDGAVGAAFLKTLKHYFEDPIAALFFS